MLVTAVVCNSSELIATHSFWYFMHVFAVLHVATTKHLLS